MATANTPLRVVTFITCLIVLAGCSPRPEPVPGVTPLPQSGARDVRLFVFPDDDETALLDLIAQARRRVWMTTYLLTDDRVIDALRTARDNGSDVRMLLEMHPYGGGGEAGARLASDRLSGSGLAVKSSNPAFRYTHQKSILVDDNAVVMTANMTRSALAGNREFIAVTADPAVVGEMATAFQADWDREPFTPSEPLLAWSPQNARERVDDLLRGAQSTLYVYAEEAQDDSQTQLLVEAARRGVDVRLIISPPSSAEETDSNAPTLDRLQQGGVKVRYLKSPYVHAKLYLTDGRLALLGSMNYSTSSLDFNRELGILVADRTALARLSATFDADWSKGLDR